MATKRKADTRPRSSRQSKRNKKDKKATSTKKPVPSLLTIAAELRTYIYELVLLDPEGEITVTKALKPPGLLAVNRQIRAECKGMWYFENKFNFDIIDCNATLLGPFMKLIEPIEIAADQKVHTLSTLIGMGMNWKNLIDWCRVVQEFGCGFNPADRDEASDNDFVAVVDAAHGIAVTHAAGKGTWEMCLQNLAALRIVAGRLDPEWLQ